MIRISTGVSMKTTSPKPSAVLLLSTILLLFHLGVLESLLFTVYV